MNYGTILCQSCGEWINVDVPDRVNEKHYIECPICNTIHILVLLWGVNVGMSTLRGLFRDIHDKPEVKE